ncbi:MAG: hypothetical protein Q8S00_32535 [Deltaproteobacteria bacterium]|nr:hypothetical protein [Deltaproteobacteria bacterium]
MSVTEIVRSWLTVNGYTGFHQAECGCLVIWSAQQQGEPGYQVDCTCKEKNMAGKIEDLKAQIEDLEEQLKVVTEIRHHGCECSDDDVCAVRRTWI